MPDTIRSLNSSRRNFLRYSLAGLSVFAAGGLTPDSMALATKKGLFDSFNQLSDLRAPDANGVRLPVGFKSRVIARSGQQVANSDYFWHAAPDGGACLETADKGWIYVSNSELDDKQGGVGALRFNSEAEVVDAYSILEGTTKNCAGGMTPWGTWLSCEEFDFGLVYECDPYGKRAAIARPALGAFEHEAVSVDTENHCLYLTEDHPQGGLYRYTPAGDLSDLDNGVLEIASIDIIDNKSTISWLPVSDPSAKDKPLREQNEKAAKFSGGEGIVTQNGMTWFTTKSDNRVCQYEAKTQELSIVYDATTSNNPILTGVDNINITPSGDLFVAEDSGDMQIVVLRPSLSATQFEAVPLLQVVGHEKSEVCGPAFDPQFNRLYFSSQRGSEGVNENGCIFEISRE